MDIPRLNAAYVAAMRALSIQLALIRGARYCAARTQLVRVMVDERAGVLMYAQYQVRSGSEAGRNYTLYYDAWRNDALCGCQSGGSAHACWHRRAVLLVAREFR